MAEVEYLQALFWDGDYPPLVGSVVNGIVYGTAIQSPNNGILPSFDGPPGFFAISTAAAVTSGGTPTFIATISTPDYTPTVLTADAAGDLISFGPILYGQQAGSYAAFELPQSGGAYASAVTALGTIDLSGTIDERGIFSGSSNDSVTIDNAGDLIMTADTTNPASNAGAGSAAVVQTNVLEIAKTTTGYANTIVNRGSITLAAGETVSGGVVSDAAGDLFIETTLGATTVSTPGAVLGTIYEFPASTSGATTAPTALYSFTSANGGAPSGPLLVDANGDLIGIAGGSLFELPKTANGYASALTILSAGTLDSAVVTDGAGDIFGTTSNSVVEIEKTATGYASTPIVLATLSVASQYPNVLLFDAAGNLFVGWSGSVGPYNPFPTYQGGEVLELAKTSTGFSAPIVLATFSSTRPYAGRGPLTLVPDDDGNLYGNLPYIIGTGESSFEIVGADFATTPATATVAGANGATLTLSFGAPTVAAAASGVLPGISPSNTAYLASGGSVTLGAGQSAAIDTSADYLAITGNGAQNESIVAAGGAFAFLDGAAGSGTVLAGAGDGVISLTGGGDWDVALGEGRDAVVARSGGNHTIAAGGAGTLAFLGTGTDLFSGSGTDTIVGGSGAATVNASGAALFFNTGGSSVFNASGATPTVVGPGAQTVNAGAASVLAFVGTDSTGGGVFNAGGGASTLVSYTGGATLNGGAGGTLFFALNGAAYNPGAGVDTVILYGGGASMTGGANGTLFFSLDTGGDTIATGAGNATILGYASADRFVAEGAGYHEILAEGAATTIDGSLSTGSDNFTVSGANDVVEAGSGNTLIDSVYGNQTLVANASGTQIQIEAAASARSVLIENFGTLDGVTLYGFTAGAAASAMQSATVVGGNEVVTLPDGSTLTFAGLTSLNAGALTG